MLRHLLYNSNENSRMSSRDASFEAKHLYRAQRRSGGVVEGLTERRGIDQNRRSSSYQSNWKDKSGSMAGSSGRSRKKIIIPAGYDIPGIEISRIETIDIEDEDKSGKGIEVLVGSKSKRNKDSINSSTSNNPPSKTPHRYNHSGSSSSFSRRYIVVRGSDASSDFSRFSEYSLTNMGSRSSRSRSSRDSSNMSGSQRFYDFSSPYTSQWDVLPDETVKQENAKKVNSSKCSSGRDYSLLLPGIPRKGSVVTFDVSEPNVRRHSSPAPSMRRKGSWLSVKEPPVTLENDHLNSTSHPSAYPNSTPNSSYIPPPNIATSSGIFLSSSTSKATHKRHSTSETDKHSSSRQSHHKHQQPSHHQEPHQSHHNYQYQQHKQQQHRKKSFPNHQLPTISITRDSSNAVFTNVSIETTTSSHVTMTTTLTMAPAYSNNDSLESIGSQNDPLCNFNNDKMDDSMQHNKVVKKAKEDKVKINIDENNNYQHENAAKHKHIVSGTECNLKTNNTFENKQFNLNSTFKNANTQNEKIESRYSSKQSFKEAFPEKQEIQDGRQQDDLSHPLSNTPSSPHTQASSMDQEGKDQKGGNNNMIVTEEAMRCEEMQDEE